MNSGIGIDHKDDQSVTEVAEEEMLRAYTYATLASLLRLPPDAAALADLTKLGASDSEMGRALAAAIPGCRAVFLPDDDH